MPRSVASTSWLEMKRRKLELRHHARRCQASRTCETVAKGEIDDFIEYHDEDNAKEQSSPSTQTSRVTRDDTPQRPPRTTAPGSPLARLFDDRHDNPCSERSGGFEAVPMPGTSPQKFEFHAAVAVASGCGMLQSPRCGRLLSRELSTTPQTSVLRFEVQKFSSSPWRATSEKGGRWGRRQEWFYGR